MEQNESQINNGNANQIARQPGTLVKKNTINNMTQPTNRLMPQLYFPNSNVTINYNFGK